VRSRLLKRLLARIELNSLTQSDDRCDSMRRETGNASRGEQSLEIRRCSRCSSSLLFFLFFFFFFFVLLTSFIMPLRKQSETRRETRLVLLGVR